MTGFALDPRKREIVALAVRAHIATGAPVSSSTIARRSKRRISSATVRNEMVDLEQAGYLQQPHTSAGRTPTAKAYELYAQEVATKASLSPARRKWINRALAAGEGDTDALLERVPHVLAELCHGVGLMLAPPLTGTALDQVRFVRLDSHRVLVVVVNRAGLVRDKVVRTREPFGADELGRMSAYLNQHFRGWTLEAIRAEMERRVAAERSRFLQQALALCRESFQPSEEHGPLHMEGLAHLTEQTDAADPKEWRELLTALEEKERLAQLLGHCVDSPERPVRVVVGLERISPGMKDFALIVAPYGRGRGLVGSLGLLSRARMDYDRAVTAVAYVATLFDRIVVEN
jgi:heat-inducible transcriptional repressor